MTTSSRMVIICLRLHQSTITLKCLILWDVNDKYSFPYLFGNSVSSATDIALEITFRIQHKICNPTYPWPFFTKILSSVLMRNIWSHKPEFSMSRKGHRLQKMTEQFYYCYKKSNGCVGREEPYYETNCYRLIDLVLLTVIWTTE